MSPQELYEQNEKLVYHVLHRRFPTLMTEDVMQAAKKGLWLACLGYDPKFGTEFSTYACKAIVKPHMTKVTCFP